MMIKPRDVQAFPIATDTLMLRSRTWDRLKFEIEYARQKGTTANSFLIKSDKILLIDPPGESFQEIFLEALGQRLDVTTLDYVLLGHVNPNRGETLQALLKIAPQITFICSNPAAISLKTILERDNLPIKVIKGDESLEIGQGHTLRFILTPNPRFPDHLCTYDTKTEILYTDKFFGAHVCGDQVFDEGWAVYREDRRYYFDCLMAPHAKQVTSALEKIKDLPVKFYAPGHGPLVRYGMTELTAFYMEWLKAQKSQDEVGVDLSGRNYLLPEGKLSLALDLAHIEVFVLPSDTIYDGRLGNNGWLQECPHPVTKLTWDNAAICSPATEAESAPERGKLFSFGGAKSLKRAVALAGMAVIVCGPF
jgi:flavorubredoxin